MIYSIQRFYKPELTNDLHDEFMQECASILLSLGKTGNEMFENLKNRFSRAFAEEEKWFKNSTADPALSALHSLSDERKHAYSGMRVALKGIVMAKLDSAESAQMLLKHFTVYQRNLNTSLEGQTAIIRNLLNALAQPEEQAALAATQTLVFYDRLQTLNEQVSEQKMRCREFNGHYVKAALRKARNAMDEVYGEAVKLMEGLANLFGGSYEKAVGLWNASIKKYKETLKARKAARVAAKKRKEEKQMEEATSHQPAAGSPDSQLSNEQADGTQPSQQSLQPGIQPGRLEKHADSNQHISKIHHPKEEKIQSIAVNMPKTPAGKGDTANSTRHKASSAQQVTSYI